MTVSGPIGGSSGGKPVYQRMSLSRPEGNAFQVGGVNSTVTIRGVQSINGIPIPVLESRMRPDGIRNYSFLGENESLLAVLARDNDLILLRGKTHQEIAEFLRLFTMQIQKRIDAYGIEVKLNPNAAMEREFDLVHKGIEYRVYFQAWMGSPDSPFNDGVISDFDAAVVRKDTKETIFFSKAHPEWIGRYGFYEGGKDIELTQEYAKSKLEAKIQMLIQQNYEFFETTLYREEALKQIMRDDNAVGDYVWLFLAEPETYASMLKGFIDPYNRNLNLSDEAELIRARLLYAVSGLLSYRLEPEKVMRMMP